MSARATRTDSTGSPTARSRTKEISPTAGFFFVVGHDADQFRLVMAFRRQRGVEALQDFLFIFIGNAGRKSRQPFAEFQRDQEAVRHGRAMTYRLADSRRQ